MSYKLAIVTPSRGLIHSRTVAAVLNCVQVADLAWWRWFFSHDLPIPDCFEHTMRRAYASGADLIWMVEEDMAPDRWALPKMMDAIASGADLAVVDYPVGMPEDTSGKTYHTVAYDGTGKKVAWCGTGCLLLRASILSRLPVPWFSLHNRLVRSSGEVTWDGAIHGGEPSGYGCDIAFTLMLYQMGFVFAVVEAECDHLKVLKNGGRGKNQGFHIVRALPAPKEDLHATTTER